MRSITNRGKNKQGSEGGTDVCGNYQLEGKEVFNGD